MRSLVLVLAFLSSCVTAYEIRQVNSVRVGDLQSRASFDLKCPRQRLVITNLTNKNEELMRVAGIDGCGQRATYFWNFHQRAWFLDASTTDTRPVSATKDR